MRALDGAAGQRPFGWAAKNFELPDRSRKPVRLGSMAGAQASIWADSWKDCRCRSRMFATNPRWQFVSRQDKRLGGILPEVCRVTSSYAGVEKNGSNLLRLPPTKVGV